MTEARHIPTEPRVSRGLILVLRTFVVTTIGFCGSHYFGITFHSVIAMIALTILVAVIFVILEKVA